MSVGRCEVDIGVVRERGGRLAMCVVHGRRRSVEAATVTVSEVLLRRSPCRVDRGGASHNVNVSSNLLSSTSATVVLYSCTCTVEALSLIHI